MADTNSIWIRWYANIIHKIVTNYNIMTFLNGFAERSSPKQRQKCCLLAFHMASIKCLWLQMNIASWLIAHSTVLLTSLTSFFQAIHGLLLATSAVKMQLNDDIKTICWYRPFVHSFANTNRYCQK